MIGLFVILGVAGILGLAMTDTGKTVGGMVKGLFITDAMKNPKLVEQAFYRGIEEAQKQYSIAADTLNELVGSVTEAKVKFDKADSDLIALESKCERLAEKGDRDGLALMVNKRQSLITNKEVFYNRMIELKPMVEEAQNIHNLWENKIAELKNNKDLKVSELKLSQDMASIYAKMDTLRKTSTTDKLLEQVDNNVSQAKRQAVGAQMVHNNKLETRELKLNQQLALDDNQAYMQSLLEKHNKQ